MVSIGIGWDRGPALASPLGSGTSSLPTSTTSSPTLKWECSSSTCFSASVDRVGMVVSTVATRLESEVDPVCQRIVSGYHRRYHVTDCLPRYLGSRSGYAEETPLPMSSRGADSCRLRRRILLVRGRLSSGGGRCDSHVKPALRHLAHAPMAESYSHLVGQSMLPVGWRDLT